MSNVKGKGQRLIPEELLKYLEAYKEAHPDPTQGGGATLDDIVDSQGNKRFIEGNLEKGSSTATITYNKWSLSGTHLMIVIAGTISSNLETYHNIAHGTLPTYINSKIFPLGQYAQLISVTKGFFVKDALSSKSNDKTSQ